MTCRELAKLLPVRIAAVVLPLLVGLGAPLAADGPNQPLGYVSGVPYAGGEYGGVDSVSTYSGALVLAVPIGQGFRVGGGGLGYGFSAIYNSNVWSYQEGSDGNQSSFVLASVNESFNAGLGWNLSLGKLLHPSVTGDGWVYVGPDGGSHKFFSTLHQNDPPGNTTHKYTRDGSYLRLNISSPSNPVVEFPNGIAHVFGMVNGVGRPSSFRDRYKDGGGNHLNTVTITYPNATTWKIEDSEGRTSYVRFTADPWTGGGRVTEVELQAYGSAPGNRKTATYTFTYESISIRRTCQDTWWQNNVVPGDPNSQEAMVAVNALTEIIGPIESPLPPADRIKWRMELSNGSAAYHLGAVRSNSECGFAGVIQQLELPTRGRTSWEWQTWNFPPVGKAYVDSSPGVLRRWIANDESIDWNNAHWLYTSTVASGHVRTEVKDPDNNVNKYYFYAPAQASLPWDYSLPIDKTTAADSAGRYLSQERTAANGSVKRQIWLKFTKDDITGIPGDDKILSNRRVVSSKVVYLDDGGKVATTDFSGFDGLGHYRLATYGGDFPLGDNSRTERTQWNYGRGCYSECSGGFSFSPIPTSSPWILGTFAWTDQNIGTDMATQRYTFNATTGALEQTRVLVDQSVDGANDVLVQICHDSKGRVVSERYYGGDTNTLTGKVIGCGTSSDSTYRIDYEYQNGVVSKATYKTPAGASVGFDNFMIPAGGVDATTGLVKTSCDSAGYCIEADFDQLGRVTQVRGAASAGSLRAATINYAYSYTSGPWQGWKIETSLSCPAGESCSSTELAGFPSSAAHFDGFGRPFKTDRLNADGTWSKQYLKYGPTGATIYSSEWTAGLTGTGTEPGTTWTNFDAMGRPQTMTLPDGHVVSWSHTGDRVSVRTSTIASGTIPASGPAPENPFTHVETYDRFGRLVRVAEPSTPGNGTMWTDLTYDVGGRMKQVTHGGQVRTYTYDRRGFLKSETIPEFGSSGNGTRYFCSFDAAGNAWKTRETPCGQSASHGVQMALDHAMRLTSVSEEGGNLLKEFVYQSNTGRLAIAKSFNYLPEVGFTVFEVDEAFGYGGIGGAVSSRQTNFYVNGIPQESFTLNMALDRAGQVKSVMYPSCAGGACGGSGPTGRTVSAEYQKGFLSKVPGFIDQPISYHPNGKFWQRRHANGMRVDQHIDSTTMMMRPQQINAFDVNSAGIMYSGVYDYDGAGNIKAKGSAFRYRYDGVSRLVESQETWGATTYIQKPTFDGHGNIQSMETGPSGSTTLLNTPTNAATNRLTSAGTVYDAVGNMTSWNGGAQYDYDRLNRMRRFRGSPAPGSEEWVFAYTAGDERILSLRVGGSGRIWSLRGLDGTLLREWRSESSVQTFKDYIWTGRHLVAKVESAPGAKGGTTETTIHAATDHLGTVRTYTDAAGLALPGHIYYPFGKQLNGTQDGERIKYTGHERDLWNTSSTADDLDYMHARHYNPQIARFLQIDPLAGTPVVPQSLNRYAYVLGNPVNLIDPSGMAAMICIMVPIPGFKASIPVCLDSVDAGGGGGGGILWWITNLGGDPGGGGRGGRDFGGGGGGGGRQFPGGKDGENNDDDNENENEDCVPWQKAVLNDVAEVTRFFTGSAPAGSLTYTAPIPSLLGFTWQISLSKSSSGAVSLWGGWGPVAGVPWVNSDTNFLTGLANTLLGRVRISGASGGYPTSPGVALRATANVPGPIAGTVFNGSAMSNPFKPGEMNAGMGLGTGIGVFAGIGVKVPLAPPEGQDFCE